MLDLDQLQDWYWKGFISLDEYKERALEWYYNWIGQNTERWEEGLTEEEREMNSVIGWKGADEV